MARNCDQNRTCHSSSRHCPLVILNYPLLRLEIGGKPLSTPLTLGPTDTLKLSFAITEKGKDGKGVQPHQTFLRFYDEKTGEEGIQPVRVNSGGKAKFELVRAKSFTCTQAK